MRGLHVKLIRTGREKCDEFVKKKKVSLQFIVIAVVVALGKKTREGLTLTINFHSN